MVPMGSLISTLILASGPCARRGASKATAPAVSAAPRNSRLFVAMFSFLCPSEIEAIYVVFVKDKRRAQSHFVIHHLKLAQPARADTLIAALKLTVGERVPGIDCQVPQIQSVPKYDVIDHTSVDVVLAHVRQRQPCDFDIGAAGLFHGLGGSGNCRGGNCHDQLHIWIDLSYCLRLCEGAIAIFVTCASR